MPEIAEFIIDPTFKAGRFELESEYRAASAGPAALVDSDGRRHPIEDPFVLGRHEDCNLSLSGSNVSRRHAEIRSDTDGLFVADLASTNGTLVNGVEITSQRLAPGDIITVGDHHLRLEVG